MCSRLLDLLLDNNRCPQIPPDRRFDLGVEPSAGTDPYLDIDAPSYVHPGVPPAKVYKQLLREVPHQRFASASTHFPELASDLEAGRDSPADPAQGVAHPPSFLTAEDMDRYLNEVDSRIADRMVVEGLEPLPLLPFLAPATGHASYIHMANGTRDGPSGAPPTSRDFALRNPVSVYNWLRKHAPKTFLQDSETHASERENGDDHHQAGSSRGGPRGKGERGGSAARNTVLNRNKRPSAAHKSAAAAEGVDHMDDEAGREASLQHALGNKGKRKRVVDDDAGYRPKGGSSRPTKKKRKSEGLEAGTPTAAPKKPRKSAGDSVAKDSTAKDSTSKDSTSKDSTSKDSIAADE